MFGCSVTCHLHFWLNDLGLSCDAVVIQGGTDIKVKRKSQQLTLEKKPTVSAMDWTHDFMVMNSELYY